MEWPMTRLPPLRTLALLLCFGSTLAEAAEEKRFIGRRMEAGCGADGTCTLRGDRTSFGTSNLPEVNFMLRRSSASETPILLAFASTIAAGGTATFVFGDYAVILKAAEKRPIGDVEPYYTAEIPMDPGGLLVLAAIENAQSGKLVFSSLGSPSRVLTVDLRDISKLMQQVDAHQQRSKTDAMSWRYRAP
jgi:hypothetical protein